MEYIFTKSYTGKVICGDIRIRKGTKAQTQGQLLLIGDKPITATHSDFAYNYTARNDDGKGKERKALTDKIRYTAAINYFPEEFIAAFANDGFMAKFRRPEHESVWLWNHDFYNAEISDLEKILTKIKRSINNGRQYIFNHAQRGAD